MSVRTPLGKRPGARFSKVPKTFRARNAIRETPTCLICKAGLFVRCRGIKIKITKKVLCLETPSFWRYKENYVTRNAPEKSRDLRETGPWNLIYYTKTHSFMHCAHKLSPRHLAERWMIWKNASLPLREGTQVGRLRKQGLIVASSFKGAFYFL